MGWEILVVGWGEVNGVCFDDLLYVFLLTLLLWKVFIPPLVQMDWDCAETRGGRERENDGRDLIKGLNGSDKCSPVRIIFYFFLLEIELYMYVDREG